MDANMSYFFSGSFENDINKKTLFYEYIFPQQQVLDYVSSVIAIPIQTILQYVLISQYEDDIFPSDIFQFSNIDDATFLVCSAIKAINNPGITYLEAGKLLLNDGKTRKKSALIKYGENHLKTAASLGLLFGLTNTYFLSCIGTVVDQLNEDDKQKLLVRLILRNKLIRRLYRASQNGKVDMRQFFYMISDTTYIRRKSNVKRILQILKESSEYDFSCFLSKLVF